jgi:hypothetical protein
MTEFHFLYGVLLFSFLSLLKKLNSFSHLSVDVALVFLATVNIPNQDGETLVHEAAFRGNLTALSILFDCGASVNVKTKYVILTISQN